MTMLELLLPSRESELRTQADLPAPTGRFARIRRVMTQLGARSAR